MRTTTSSRRTMSRLMCGVAGVLMIDALMAPAASAQQAVPAQEPQLATQAATDAADDAAAVPDQSDIVVTGTRVIRDGYNAPTPTTVIGAADIQAKAPANLADFVNELPAFSGSSTPRTTIAAIGAGNAGINALNLRNLGVNRTLVLLDGQRVGASSLSGFVDINQFPQALVKRVDVVTGGASAGWGSDAVAGVVNFILDRTYTGLKGEIEGGVTTYGDDRNYRASLTGGTSFADGRGHVIASAEIAYNQGIKGLGKRDWYDLRKIITNPAYTATNGQPQLLVRPDTGFATATPGGIITTTALRGTYFGEGGTPLQFNYGPIVSSNFMVGGQARYADFGASGDLDPELKRQTAFGRASYKISDAVEVFAQLTYGRSETFVEYTDQSNLGNLTIRSDNANLPATVAARAAALGLASFGFGTLNQDLGPIAVTTRRSSWRPVIGANGSFESAGTTWKWDVYAQKSITRSYVGVYTTITANYNNAIDVVRNASGAIVCRSSIANPANGCVPYNIFGTGVNGDAAFGYIKGTSYLNTRIDQDVYAGNLRGNPFSTWAGPVSVALGYEHRREKTSGDTDALSPNRRYFVGNYTASFGSYNVDEGYLETVVPLAKGSGIGDSLDLGAAVRVANYSTSGTVATWKLGLTYVVTPDITFRATRSRDIRAPNLSELFLASQALTAIANDPARGNASTQFFQINSGNRELKPEKADTLSVGAVFSPSFLPGLATSIDYWKIDLNGAIASVSAQIALNQCAAGNAVLCSQITRNAANVITQVAVKPINLATQLARGLDVEASYRRPLAGGEVTLRFLGTRYLKNEQNNGINIPVDFAGTNFGNGTLATSLPKFSYRASIGWDGDLLGINLAARGFSAGVYSNNYIECTSGCPTSTPERQTIESNRLPGAVYLDASGRLRLTKNVEAYVAVDNLLNKDPASVGWVTGGAPVSVNQALYDALGRRFRAGIRFRL